MSPDLPAIVVPVAQDQPVKIPWKAWSFERKVLAGLVGVALLAAVGCLISWNIDDYPVWLEALATAAALVAAVFAARYAFGAFELESQREDRWIRQQRSEQASKIAAWPANLMYDYVPGPEDLEVEGSITGVRVNLRNASDVPVTRVWIDATVMIDQGADRPHPVHLATREVKRLLEPSVEPIQEFLAADKQVDPRDYIPGDFKGDWWCQLSVSFRDAGGRDWERLPDGQLLLVQDADAHD